MALFDRAPARVYVLARRFGKDTLVTRATQIDAGFDPVVLAPMLATLGRLTDTEIPLPDGTTPAELRAFYNLAIRAIRVKPRPSRKRAAPGRPAVPRAA